MSGICGLVQFDGERVDSQRVEALLDAMQFSGTHRQGVRCLDDVGFGHQAMHATPESISERQPMISLDGDCLLVVDARIDNREALMSALPAVQASADSPTDADLVLAAFERWGQGCTSRLIGDWALARYDRRRQELLLARDHLGMRPLYYCRFGNSLAFCSELHALFSLPQIRPRPDRQALNSLLLLDAVPPDLTCFAGIRRLQGGQQIAFRRGATRQTRYWHMASIEPRPGVSFGQAVDEFRSLFDQSVRARLRSNGPVGCELSGGLDSSSVLAVAAHGGGSVQPFALRFGSLACDEGPYIDALCAPLGLEAREIRADRLDCAGRYSLDSFYASPRDWPADLFFTPHVALAEDAREQGVRVILTGQGGDEVLQGSRWIYHDHFHDGRWAELLAELRSSASPWFDLNHFLLRPLLPAALRRLARRARGWLRGAVWAHGENLRRSLSRQVELSPADFSRRTAWDTARLLSGGEAALWRDANVYHQFGADGIDVRHPFFDVRLIEARLSLPVEFYYHRGVFKRLLRHAMADYLPEKISRRHDKAEFGEVIRTQVEAARNSNTSFGGSSDRLAAVFDAQVWNGTGRLHAKRHWDDQQTFLEWKLLNLHSWYRYWAKRDSW